MPLRALLSRFFPPPPKAPGPWPIIVLDEFLAGEPQPGFFLHSDPPRIEGPSGTIPGHRFGRVLCLELAGTSHVALKVKRGPVFSLVRAESSEEARATAHALAQRLGVRMGGDYAGDARACLLEDASQLFGPASLSLLGELHEADFDPPFIGLPVRTTREEPYWASAEIVLAPDGVTLVNALGRSRPLCPLGDLVAVRGQEVSSVRESSDTFGFRLFLDFKPGYTYTIYSHEGMLHDDPIRGESDELRAHQSQRRQVLEELARLVGAAVRLEEKDFG